MLAANSNELVSEFIDGGVLIAFIPLFIVAVLATPWVSRRFGSTGLSTGLALVSIAAIAAVTLGVRTLTFGSGVDFSWILDADLWSGAISPDADWMLNLALFIPAGLFSMLAWRNSARSIIGLALLSLAIECAQSVMGLGASDPSDLVANTLGAATGTGLGVAFIRLGGDHSGQRWGERRRIVLMAGALLVVAVGLAGWVGLRSVADSRRSDLADELEDAFNGTTLTDIADSLGSESRSDELLSAISVSPDYVGQIGTGDEFGARYSIVFLGFHRCVFVRWSAGGYSLSNGSGSECTVFRDRPPEDTGPGR